MIHSVLRRAFNQALRWGMIGRNPAIPVTRPKQIRKELHTLSDFQVREFLLRVRGSRYEALYQLAVTTGLRQGELLGLRWSDLDWVSHTLRVQRQLHRVPKEGLVFSEPKSASGRRVIVIGLTTLGKLQEHLEIQQIERQFAGSKWIENDLIFPSRRGTPEDPSNLVKHFKTSLKQSGLPEIRFHDLRHTAATLMLQQGVHPKIVQERLGHSQISLTLDTYSHVLPSMQEKTAIKMDNLVTPIAVSLQ